MKFIKLTTTSGDAVYSNIEAIASVGSDDEFGLTEIWDTGGIVTRVTESVDEVMKLIVGDESVQDIPKPCRDCYFNDGGVSGYCVICDKVKSEVEHGN